MQNAISEYLQSLSIIKKEVKREGQTTSHYYVDKSGDRLQTMIYEEIDSRAFNILFSMNNIKGAEIWVKHFKDNPDISSLNYLEIATHRGQEVLTLLYDSLASLMNEKIKMKQALTTSIDKNETPKSFMEI